MKARNKLITNLLGCLAILVVGFIMASPIRAQEKNPPTPDFEFSDVTKLTLDPLNPSNIFILNKTALSFLVQLQVTDFNFVPLGDQSVGEVIAIEDVSGQPVTSVFLQPAESKRLILKTSASELAKLKPGTYTAFLVVDELDTSRKVIRRELEIVVKAGTAPAPLVEKWTLRAVRNNLFSDALVCSPACYLPLAVPESGIVATAGLDTQLGVLVAEGEEPVIVRGSTLTEEKDGITRLPLVLKNLKKPGAYSGTLDLLPNDEKAGTIEVTLNATDAWWWPLLALLVGVLLAFLAQLFEAIGRKIWILKYRRENISPGKTDGKKYDEAKKVFCANIDQMNTVPETKDKFKGYSDCLRADLDLRAKKLVKPINALWFTPTPTLDEQNKEYKAVLDELDFIESQLEVWQEFGVRWVQAYDTIAIFKDEFKADKPQWPWIEGKFPNFTKTAESYWNGNQIQLGRLAILDDQVQKVKILAEEWPKLHKEVDTYRKYIQLLYSVEMPKEYQEDLYTADRLISQAWAELWLARDADDLKEKTTRADIDRAEALILGLYKYYVKQKYEKATGKVMGLTLFLTLSHVTKEPDALIMEYKPDRLAHTFKSIWATIKDRVLPVEDHALMAKRYVRARLTREIFFAVLALGLAVLTGMTTLYFGKNFGSLQDYLSIGTWGLVTKGALEGLNAAVDKLRGFYRG